MVAGHFDSNHTLIFEQVRCQHFSVVSCLDPGYTSARSSARKQHALVCDRLNYTIYKIVNNICILYTRLVFPTVKGKA